MKPLTKKQRNKIYREIYCDFENRKYVYLCHGFTDKLNKEFNNLAEIPYEIKLLIPDNYNKINGTIGWYMSWDKPDELLNIRLIMIAFLIAMTD